MAIGSPRCLGFPKPETRSSGRLYSLDLIKYLHSQLPRTSLPRSGWFTMRRCVSISS